MDWNTQTIKTYDQSAKKLAEYFKDAGARVEDIKLGLKLAQAGANARVVEVGCGDGRDAEEIAKHVGWYEGFDPSEGLLEIARKRLPHSSFVKDDALSYQYPDNLDVIYAFASLLHVNKTNMKEALAKATAALKEGGILYISLKERPLYEEEVKEDQYGKRMFYYYNPQLIKDLAGDALTPVHEYHYTIGPTDWFNVALKK
jgi:ubiquinone/menaquinone biosynthesis C-methylase UbiE